jgi:hypothetical protein
MTRALAFATPTLLLALLGCDPERGAPDDDTEFRTITFVPLGTQTGSYKMKGCDPDWWYAEAFGEEEWMAMIHTQSRMQGDEMLERTFLADPESAALCIDACEEADGRWTGDVQVTRSSHEFGETELGARCAADMIATVTPTDSVGDIACACG